MFTAQKSPSVIRRLSILTGISFFLCALALMVTDASGQPEKSSVVLIHTSQDPTKGESGYGVAWKQPDNIVTVLHLVAGKPEILVSWNEKQSFAKIKKIHKDADLALLELDTPLGIPPLEIYQGNPPAGRPLNYWETPKHTFRMDGKQTKLNIDKGAVPLSQLSNRIPQDPKSLAKFATSLCPASPKNYPVLEANVFNFDEPNVGKSHSGSPLTYNGKIVGMVDGGVKPLGGKTVVWAIPAAQYFDKLLAGAAPPKLEPCASAILYGGFREDNPLIYKDHGSGDSFTFYPAYRASFQSLYETMFEEDQQFIRELLEDEEGFEDGPITLRDLFKESIDVYEDDETGATIAFPTDGEVTFEKSDDGKHTLIEVSDPDYGIEMTIFVERAASKAAAEEIINWYKEYVVSDGQKWEQEKDADGEPVPDDVDDELWDDPDEPYYSESMDRVVYGADGKRVVGELYASITIDDKNFLGVAVSISDWANLTKAQRLSYYLMEACAILSDFAYY